MGTVKTMEPVNVAYNMDCMEYMRSLPDKAFDLAVVDPPYGDGSQSVNAEREREREAGYNRFGGWWNRYKRDTTDSASGSTSTRIPRGGYHGKDKYHMGQPGPGEHGQPNTAKK